MSPQTPVVYANTISTIKMVIKKANFYGFDHQVTSHNPPLWFSRTLLCSALPSPLYGLFVSVIRVAHRRKQRLFSTWCAKLVLEMSKLSKLSKWRLHVHYPRNHLHTGGRDPVMFQGEGTPKGGQCTTWCGVVKTM